MSLKLAMIRHGQSIWNRDNLFTGWTDVDLSEQGVEEAHEAAIRFREAGCGFDIVFTSVLKRAIKTTNIVLEDLDLLWLPVEKAWQLNERHYGGLQGLNKKETAEKYGADQVHEWRRSYATRPPPLEPGDKRSSRGDPRYAELSEEQIPQCESLKDTVERVLPYWDLHIAPLVKAGKSVLVSAHGNSLRALIKHLDGLREHEVEELEIPTGRPLIYELDQNLKPSARYYLEV